VGVQRAVQQTTALKYWEVGNEVYGNGTYGANWEADSHCDTSPSGVPGHDRQRALADLQLRPGHVRLERGPVHDRDARREPERQGLRDPHHARVLAPTGVTNSQTSTQPWNQTVLTALGSSLQCV